MSVTWMTGCWLAVGVTVSPQEAPSTEGPPPQEVQAPPHRRPMIEREGKTLLWAAGNPNSENVAWFDVTGSQVDPAEFQRGVGRDTIPPVKDPEFARPDDPRLVAAQVTDETEVLGVVYDGIAKAYPMAVMDRQEVVNDQFGETPVAVLW